MHTGYEDWRVVCPFYRKDTKRSILCESPIACTTLEIDFRDADRKKTYKNDFCRSMTGYKRCPVAGIQKGK